MEERMVYLTNPANIVSFILFVFGLGVAWSTLNGKIKELEKRLDKLDELNLGDRLTRMEANLDWIREAIEELRKR